MVLMTVSNDNAPYSVGVLFNISKIRDNNVNAGHIAVRESKTAVNDKNVVGAFKNGKVLSYLVKTAQRDYLYGSSLYRLVV